LASILTDLVKQERLGVLAAPAFDSPRTKQAVELLQKMGMEGRKVLFVTPDPIEIFEKSVRNLPRVKSIPAKFLNPHDLMSHEFVVLFDGSVEPIVKHLTSPRRPVADQEVSA
jgi:large subunit ribosomal protein L4